jgi:sulfur dioxygenase
MTSVAEEKSFNPRLGGVISERDFAGYMSNLNLPHPKKIDIAVPANIKCGATFGKSGDGRSKLGASCSDLCGYLGDSARVACEHRASVQIIDVREAEEFNGPSAAFQALS